MVYAATAKSSEIIASIKIHFAHNTEFRAKEPVDPLVLEWINEAQDEIYQECYPQPDKNTLTTVAGTWYYPMDGTTGNLAVDIDEIQRVIYDGQVLERLMMIGQVIPPSTDDDNGTPDGYFEFYDGGVRYLGFNAKPDDVLTVDIYGTRKAPNLAATTSAPSVELDFWGLIKFIVIKKTYEYLGEFKSASYYKDEYVVPGLSKLKKKVAARFGKVARQRATNGPFDVLG